MDTMVTRPPQSPGRSWRGIAAVVAVAVAALLAFVALGGLVRDPDTVPRIRVVNQRDDLVDVLVRTGDGSLLPVALVDPQRTDVAHDIVDQGQEWTFVVQVSDRTVDRIPLTRAQLERSDWTVTVPAPSG